MVVMSGLGELHGGGSRTRPVISSGQVFSGALNGDSGLAWYRGGLVRHWVWIWNWWAVICPSLGGRCPLMVLWPSAWLAHISAESAGYPCQSPTAMGISFAARIS